MVFVRKDHYYKWAKREGKASRAAYKLEELQERFRLVKEGATVIDLGCAPGGWMQELSKLVGKKGKVIGVDPLPLRISFPKNCVFIKGDAFEYDVLEMIKKLAGKKVDAVLSDMSPNLSGVGFADSYRSFELATRALEFGRKLLKRHGHLVIKIFPGDETAELVEEMEKHFEEVGLHIPKATRKTSSERYLVAMRFKAESS